MAGFEQQVKKRAYEVKHLVTRGFKVVSHSCKRGWYKIRHIRG